MSFPERLLQTIRRLGLIGEGSRVVVAVSGGADSLALLHALAALRQPLRLELVVATLDHRLRGDEGAADAAFVCDQASELGLLCIREQRDAAAHAEKHRLGIEEAAREVRYSFLADVARVTRSPLVAVAHTADDQAETVLMHFLRGSGLSGLKGMLPLGPFPPIPQREPGDSRPAQGLRLVRPLLYTTRAEVERYLESLGVVPRQDATNVDPAYYRNRLRHELLPLLERYQPKIREVLARTAEALASDWAFIAGETAAAWERVARPSEGAIVFEREPFRALPDALQRHLLREAVGRLRPAVRDLSWEQLTQATAVARDGGAGAAATLPGGLSLFVLPGELIVAEELPLPDWPLLEPGQDPAPVAVPGVSALPGGWSLVVEPVAPRAADEARRKEDTPFEGNDAVGGRWEEVIDAEAAGQALALRTRRAGDRFRPLGLGGQEVELAEWMIGRKIPAHARERLPLLVNAEDEILWVAGHRLSERARITPGTRRALRVRFERKEERRRSP